MDEQVLSPFFIFSGLEMGKLHVQGLESREANRLHTSSRVRSEFFFGW